MMLIDEIQSLVNESNQYLKSMQNWGIKRAQAEQAYQTVLSQEVLKERDKGTAIGVISLTVKGKAEVAEKRLERDIAETMYNVSQEKINLTKLQMRLLEGQAQREWSVNE